MTRIIKLSLLSITSVTRSCDVVSEQKSLTAQEHARYAWCYVVRDAMMVTTSRFRCSSTELLPIFSEFCDILFSNFKFQIHAI